MKSIRVFIFFVLLANGCAGVDLHLKDSRSLPVPESILIYNFQVRDLGYDPYLSPEFSEAMGFAFFKEGYPVKVVGSENSIDDINVSEKISLLCENYKADMLITGVISRRETGYLTDRKTGMGITFLVYNGEGVLVGKGYYSHKDSTDSAETARKAASEFVKKLVSGFGG